MNFNIKELRKEYDKEKIDAFVESVKSINAEVIDRGKELIKRLWYLEKTKRYREFDDYEKASFKDFLWEICHIPYNRYYELRYAYHWFPKEAEKYGPQTIQKVKTRVGVVRLPETLKEMEKVLVRAKGGFEREKINEVIDQIAPAKAQPPKSDSKSHWKSMADQYRTKYESLLKSYRLLEKENEKLKEQLERQRTPIETFSAIRNLMEPALKSA